MMDKAAKRLMLRMTLMGFSKTQLARHFQTSRNTVHRTIRSEFGKAYLKELEMNAMEMMKEMEIEALQVKRSLMNSDETPAALRDKIASDLLDRTGKGAVKTSQTMQFNASGSLNLDDLTSRALGVTAPAGLLPGAVVVEPEVDGEKDEQ